ncbi:MULTISPECIES: 2-hydroxychromene-2-carboxylate isomerase [Rhodobacterales]|uniref:2-hydroxychromene-2-carboxylate isomerase n=1 Tax=Rhodobacterales TaxID=204455 RepID=UPI003298F9D8
MAHIDYYFATLSPYAYLAGMRMEAVAKKHGATVTYKPLDLMTLFGRTGGTPPKDRHISRIEYRAIELERQSQKLGMDFNLKPSHWPTNMAPSSYAIIAAQKTGGDVGALTHAFLRACWAEEKDIAQDDVIRACLESAGFDPALADSDLMGSADTYAANLEEAYANGVFGAPFYVVDGAGRFWGQDKIDDLDAHLASLA